MDHRKFTRDGTGVHTVEGNLAGARAARLTKQRTKDQEAFEQKKRKIAEEQERRTKGIDSKFALSTADKVETSFRAKTYGLVTAEEFRRAREEIEKGIHGDRSSSLVSETKDGGDGRSEELKLSSTEKKKRERKRKRKRAMLSFGEDEDEDGEKATPSPKAESTSVLDSATKPDESEKLDPPVSKLKNPDVNTDFLPDRLREEALQRERLRLEKEWREEQERVKGEALEVTYSYWDGSGHRRALNVKKGMTIGKFVEKVRQQLIPEFPELRTTASDELIYVKEDLMIPHHYSFYDLIVTKARGKSGPLFHFDVHDDVRLTNDATVEKDESHPGKVVDRRWYDRNRHIFPASRWEMYDPRVQRGKYTIHGGEVSSK